MLIGVALVTTFLLVGCSDPSSPASRSVVDEQSKRHTNAFKDLLTVYLEQTVYGPAPDWDEYFAVSQSEMTDELQSLIGRVYFLMESEVRDGSVTRRKRSHNSVLVLLAGLRLRVQALVSNSEELRKDSEAVLSKVDTSSKSGNSGGISTDKMMELCMKISKTPSDCKVSVLKTLIASYMVYPLCMRKLPREMPREPRLQICGRMATDFQSLEYSTDDQYNQLLQQAYRDQMEVVHLIADEPRSEEHDKRIMKLADSALHIPEVKNWESWGMSDRKKLIDSQAKLSTQP